MAATKSKPMGRPKGAASVRTRQIANKLAAQGLTPLEVMIDNMTYFFHEAKRKQGEYEALDPRKQDSKQGFKLYREFRGDRLVANECAEKAAPFIHPKLQAIMGDRKGGPLIIHFSEGDEKI